MLVRVRVLEFVAPNGFSEMESAEKRETRRRRGDGGAERGPERDWHSTGEVLRA